MANERPCGGGDNFMKYYIGAVMYDSNYLEHYRTKGSKNGVRLYQYEDGTLTPAGIERYRKNNGRDLTDDEYNEHVARAVISGNAEEVHTYRNRMTNQQLNDALNRIDSYAKLESKMPKKKDLIERLGDFTKGAEKLFESYDRADKIISRFTGEHLPGLSPEVVRQKIGPAQKAANELLSKLGNMTPEEVKSANEKLNNMTNIEEIARTGRGKK